MLRRIIKKTIQIICDEWRWSRIRINHKNTRGWSKSY